MFGSFTRGRVLALCAAGAAVGGAFAGGALATGSAARSSAAVDEGIALQSAYVSIIKSISPSVVQIEDKTGLGSGVVFDSRGDIVTNHHVVAGATSFTVTTSSGKRYPARLVGSFAPDDIAVIRIPASAGLAPATFADSSALRVGDLVVAIGNPLGLRSSVTNGIVSAFRQAMPEPGGATLPSVIQTSAAINPGNSGGALTDIQGRVIGIPTLAATDPEVGGSAPGIGFALPSNLVKDIASQIATHGKVINSHRAYLGVEIVEANGGVYVAGLTPGGPAATAGIHAGEVIVSVDGARTPTTTVLSEVLVRHAPGQRVPVVVESQGGAGRTVHLTLGQYPGT